MYTTKIAVKCLRKANQKISFICIRVWIENLSHHAICVIGMKAFLSVDDDRQLLFFFRKEIIFLI